MELDMLEEEGLGRKRPLFADQRAACQKFSVRLEVVVIVCEVENTVDDINGKVRRKFL